jgi:type VI secretion system secreted protein Hcp
MPIYIKYGDIKGDVTAEGHKGSDGWVEVNSFQFGVGRGISSPTGGSDDREASAPSVSEVVVTKPMDVSSFAWLEASLWGEGVACTIDFCKTDKDKLEIYAQYVLTNTMVSGYSVSSGGDRPQESLSLNFTKFEFSYFQMGAAGAAGDTPKTGYDIGLAKKV